VRVFGCGCNLDMGFLYGLKAGGDVEGALCGGCLGMEFLNSSEIGADAPTDESVG
jgi:hypothetical protein